MNLDKRISELVGEKLKGICPNHKEIQPWTCPHCSTEFGHNELLDTISARLKEAMEKGEIYLEIPDEEELSKIIQDTRQVGMLKHYYIGKDWADLIAIAIIERLRGGRDD